MNIDLEHIRSANSIESVIAEVFPLRRTATRFIGVEHDSLVVTPRSGFYHWNSRGEYGDVFDFTGRYVLNYGNRWNNRDALMFLEAVRNLAQRAGIQLDETADFKRSSLWAERELLRRLHETLMNHSPALQYATATRGWQLSTVKSAWLGYMPADKRSLLADLGLSDRWQRVIRQFPADMLVYPHLEKSRLTYLSGRSITEKKHYNPARDVIGERQLFYNNCYRPDSDQVVLIEGQADAVTFAEWDVPAVAIAGMNVSDDLLTVLRRHRRVFVLLDNVPETTSTMREICSALGAAAYLPKLPNGIKDANQWLTDANADADQAAQLLNDAPGWLDTEIERVGNLTGLAREDGISGLFQYTSSLDTYQAAQFKHKLAKIGVKGRLYHDLLQTAQDKSMLTEDRPPQILGDDVPLLSPALGFQRDLAVVTVVMLERTADRKIRCQPYLVTSGRELKRLNDEQLITLNGKEVALRVIPEGCEFLMRWRCSDVQRFLQGETVDPKILFETIHDLFTRHIDFKSPVESRILTLWTVGTYFYTMFPAYPYLALNGPKNSGKSSVLQVAQPLAFNMINTSDPTGPSLFRLIHQTSCTVGLDEAERFHNPKDAAMQQIRQLLNSGYKAGMPAIRLIGDDHKPQAFHVYSPKILAAIAGLEDVLASRCIAIPMRRTDRQMPSFPANFDGASIRHQLYTLALTHFQAVYTNYFECPDLHKLPNRSGELWSPLVALAALFESAGVAGLLEAVKSAAHRDEQLGAGKALGDREEAILQALELLTRGTSEQNWIAAAALRKQVAQLLEQSEEKLGDAQWIGHILKRLHLLDEQRRKRSAEGMVYAIDPNEVRDLMRRYEVAVVMNLAS